MACNGSIAWPTTTPRQCIIVMLDLIINFSAGIVGVGNSFMLPPYSVLLCHGGLIVAYYFVAEVAEFVMIAAYPYKTKTPPTITMAIGGGLLNKVARRCCCVIPPTSFALTIITQCRHGIDP